MNLKSKFETLKLQKHILKLCIQGIVFVCLLLGYILQKKKRKHVSLFLSVYAIKNIGCSLSVCFRKLSGKRSLINH